MHLTKLSRLKELNLDSRFITDAAMPAIAAITTVELEAVDANVQRSSTTARAGREGRDGVELGDLFCP